MKTQLLQDIDENGSHAASRLLADGSPVRARMPRAAPFAPYSPEPEVQQRKEPSLAEDAAPAFAGESVDWPGQLPRSEPHWFDRWGRQATLWGLGLGATALVATGALWLYRESRIDSTLIALARNSSLPVRPARPPALPVAPAPGAGPEAPAFAGAEATAGPAQSVQAAKPDPVTLEPERAPPPAIVAPAPLPAQQAPAKARTARKSYAVAPETDRARTQMADTLRQCRMLGYHAAQCIARGCFTTRYGLVCKG
jgi:hypothetical protein